MLAPQSCRRAVNKEVAGLALGSMFVKVHSDLQAPAKPKEAIQHGWFVMEHLIFKWMILGVLAFFKPPNRGFIFMYCTYVSNFEMSLCEMKFPLASA